MNTWIGRFVVFLHVLALVAVTTMIVRADGTDTIKKDAGDIVDKSKDLAQKGADKTAEVAGKVGDAVKSGVAKAGDVAGKVGDKIKDGASKAGDAVENAADAVKDKLSGDK